jgi:hypothetical protein
VGPDDTLLDPKTPYDPYGDRTRMPLHWYLSMVCKNRNRKLETGPKDSIPRLCGHFESPTSTENGVTENEFSPKMRDAIGAIPPPIGRKQRLSSVNMVDLNFSGFNVIFLIKLTF